MVRKFIKGDSVEECLDSIDLVLQSWAPRLSSHVIGILPSIPILHHQRTADETGCIFAGILPFTGKITTAFLAIGKYKTKPLTVVLTIHSAVTHSGATLQAEKPIITYSAEIMVTAGDVVRVVISPPDGAEEFLIGMLCHPDVEHSKVETHLISELRALERVQESTDDAS